MDAFGSESLFSQLPEPDVQEATPMKATCFARALLVDNDPGVAQVIETIFRSDKFDVTTAMDAESGLRLFEARRDTLLAFELVILDLRMPGIGGMGFVRRMAALQGTLPPIVVVSGFVADEDRHALEDSPFVHGIIEKPFDLFHLLACAKDAVLANRTSDKSKPCLQGELGLIGGDSEKGDATMATPKADPDPPSEG